MRKREMRTIFCRLGQEVQVEVNEADAVEVVLRAGEMSLHHAAIIHGSRSNRSDTQRLGFIVRFVTSAYDLASQQTPFILARGGRGLGTCTSPSLRRSAR